MKKTYLKTLLRTFTHHKARFLSLILIVVVCVGFISGIGSTKDKINSSLTEYYIDCNVSDLIIKSTDGSGFTEESAEAVEEILGEGSHAVLAATLDLKTDTEKRSVRYLFSENFDEVNFAKLVEGRTPSSGEDGKHEIVCENSDNVLIEHSVGDKITIDFEELLTKLAEQNGETLSDYEKIALSTLEPQEFTIVGIVQNPLYFADDGEPSYNNGEDVETPDIMGATENMDVLESVYYISAAAIPQILGNAVISYTDIYASVADRDLYSSFSAAYLSYIDECKTKIVSALGENTKCLDLEQNYSFKSLTAYADKVANVGWVLMAAFLVVTMLVAVSNMTRLLEEERAQIACLKTQGYSPFGIISKYLLFAFIATCIGCVGAYFLGVGLMYLIYYVFNYTFVMPPISSHIAVIFFIITATIIVVSTVAVTAFSGIKMARTTPAALLRPKPPKAGKKVFLERIPLIWSRLSFKYKSTLRNVLRYRSRFLMTVVAVAMSTALVLAGLALLDLCLFGDFGSSSIIGIALVIVIFAGLLTMVVVYTLTNINVSERSREIATLMVLGYYDGEVTGYIYREVYINTIIGIIFGYPLSILFMYMIFSAFGFGSISGVSWFMWLVAPVVVLLFTALVTLILRRKIVGVDMNGSLKAIE